MFALNYYQTNNNDLVVETTNNKKKKRGEDCDDDDSADSMDSVSPKYNNLYNVASCFEHSDLLKQHTKELFESYSKSKKSRKLTNNKNKSGGSSSSSKFTKQHKPANKNQKQEVPPQKSNKFKRTKTTKYKIEDDDDDDEENVDEDDASNDSDVYMIENPSDEEDDDEYSMESDEHEMNRKTIDAKNLYDSLTVNIFRNSGCEKKIKNMEYKTVNNKRSASSATTTSSSTKRSKADGGGDSIEKFMRKLYMTNRDLYNAMTHMNVNDMVKCASENISNRRNIELMEWSEAVFIHMTMPGKYVNFKTLDFKQVMNIMLEYQYALNVTNALNNNAKTLSMLLHSNRLFKQQKFPQIANKMFITKPIINHKLLNTHKIEGSAMIKNKANFSRTPIKIKAQYANTR
jgi:hypothetical protein